jgi:hypothetical protein
MSVKVCLATNTLALLEAAGHMWHPLNWALGLKALGCQVYWLEQVDENPSVPKLRTQIMGLKDRLKPFGLSDCVVLTTPNSVSLTREVSDVCLGIDESLETDLLLNLGNKVDADTVARFRRSALIDIDPGILQIWSTEFEKSIPRHDVYFSTGETVGTSAARFPNCGVCWHYTPTAVYLPAWPLVRAKSTAPYTTVSSWWGWWEVFQGETFNNEKRTSFLEYLDLPKRTSVKLELALSLWDLRDHDDVRLLEANRWTVRHAFDVSSTPEEYRDYLGRSRGEFSCAKPSCMRLQNAWISDRSLCYMAMGKPVVVQYTGPSRFLPDADGLFRFRSLEGAAQALADAEADYERHSRQARALVEEYFDAEKVVRRVLERALA